MKDRMNLKEILAIANDYEHTLPPAPARLEVPPGAALAGWIDHTLLKPEAASAQVEKLCAEARQYGFATVCVNPVHVPLAAVRLQGSGVGICTVIAFPLGAHLPEFKAQETRHVVQLGATEVDMVINIGALKGEAYALALEDVQAVVESAHARAVHVKVIIENALLTRREKIIACLLCQAAGADFVKTSTGFSASGATVNDVDLMRRVVGAGMGVKAAGGIRTWQEAVQMISAGANRLGASASVAILAEAEQQGAAA
jgi:deoxyribose-phosphate aldolase